MTWRRHDRLAAGERINEMFDGNLVRVPDRGEVDLAIPCDQFVSIHGQFGNLTGSEPNPEFCSPLEQDLAPPFFLIHGAHLRQTITRVKRFFRERRGPTSWR